MKISNENNFELLKEKEVMDREKRHKIRIIISLISLLIIISVLLIANII